MNTVKIGDKFEDRCFNVIKEAISKKELGLDPNSLKIFQKKGYYSKDRESKIIFDLSIEVWPKSADRYTMLLLIECKGYNSKGVPVDDVEEFYTKINQVAGANLKGIMISETSFQSGGLNFGKNKGFMMIELNPDNTYSIIFHRSKDEKVEEKVFNKISNLLIQALKSNRVIGLKRLRAVDIENRAEKILIRYNKLQEPINLIEFQNYLSDEFDLEFDFSNHIQSVNGKDIQGCYDVKNNKIYISNSLFNTPTFPFILGHEIGHFFLHRNLNLDQSIYNSFEDSEYNPFTNRFELTNDKHWIEWQANKFSISLLLPRKLFLKELISFRKKIGIPNPQRIYLDDQAVNQQDFYRTIYHLATYFGTSLTAIKFRIEGLDIITYDGKGKNIGDVLRNILSKFDR